MMAIIRLRVVPKGTPDYDDPPNQMGDKTLAQATALMWGLREAANGGVRHATDFVLAMGCEDVMPPLSPFGTLPSGGRE